MITNGERKVDARVDNLLGDVVEVVPAVVGPQPGVERRGNVADIGGRALVVQG